MTKAGFLSDKHANTADWGNPADRLIVALDVPTIEQAEATIETLGDRVEFYKIGYQLVPVGGFSLAQKLAGTGKKVFLDLKYHDIGATVAKGVQSVRSLGAELLTVHAVPSVVRAASKAADEDPALKILAVTVLTDQSVTDLAASIGKDPSDLDLTSIVVARAEMAMNEGADGVVASPLEAGLLRKKLGPSALIVTPGVRPKGADVGDQKRIATPGDAIASGASHLVVGRPIVGAEDPAAAAGSVLGEMTLNA
ncbi:MAG: orotidine-5'-phosphate decarboxylase [Pseudomonadota bacterium]